MRLPAASYLLTFVLANSTCSTAAAETDPFTAAVAEARRALEAAKIEARLYWQVEYPRERRELDAAIRLTDRELRAYKERLREYRPFNRFSTGGALLVPIQELELCLLETELRLKNLRAERNALVRFHSDQMRLNELKVQQARAHLAGLLDGEIIVIEPSP